MAVLGLERGGGGGRVVCTDPTGEIQRRMEAKEARLEELRGGAEPTEEELEKAAEAKKYLEEAGVKVGGSLAELVVETYKASIEYDRRYLFSEVAYRNSR